MLALILAFSPFVVSGATGLLKMLPPFTKLSDAARTPGVRVLAAVLAFIYVLFSAYITGSLNADALTLSVQTLALSLMAWLGSLGVFHAFFQKAPAVGTAPVV